MLWATTQQKHLKEALLMSSHNICFGREIRKKYHDVDILSCLELSNVVLYAQQTVRTTQST